MFNRFEAEYLRGPFALIRTTDAAIEPITLADAKTHLRIDTTDDDAYVTALITVARQWLEEYTGRSFISQSWAFSFQNWFDWEIKLPRAAPLISVDSIKYYDINGIQQTLDPSVYQVDDQSDIARLRPYYNQVWPSVQYRMSAITVAYTAGYGTDATKVPKPLIQALKLLLGHYYENRQEVVVEAGRTTAVEPPMGVTALASPYRVQWF